MPKDGRESLCKTLEVKTEKSPRNGLSHEGVFSTCLRFVASWME